MASVNPQVNAPAQLATSVVEVVLPRGGAAQPARTSARARALLVVTLGISGDLRLGRVQRLTVSLDHVVAVRTSSTMPRTGCCSSI